MFPVCWLGGGGTLGGPGGGEGGIVVVGGDAVGGAGNGTRFLRPTRRRVTNGCSERPACPRKFLDAKKAHSKREFRHTDGNAGTCRGATLSFAARLAGERKMGR